MSLTLTEDLEVFAKQQGKVQRTAEQALRSSVRFGLLALRRGEKNWSRTIVSRTERLLRQRYYAETGHRTSIALRREMPKFRQHVRQFVSKTKKPERGEDLSTRIAQIVSTLATTAVNAAVHIAAGESDDPASLVKVWVSMEDERVRPTHRAADGQRVPIGESFTVGGFKMSRPGDLRAPIEETINCRCLMAVMRDTPALAAAVSQDRVTGVGIFLLPHSDHPVNAMSTEDMPHVTTVWLGDLGEDFDISPGDIRQDVRTEAAKFQATYADVMQRGTLGDNEADVLFLDVTSLAPLRDAMLSHETIHDQMKKAERHPEWTPHLTLGYPDRPSSAADGDLPTDILFDRVALWVGNSRYEYPLGGDMQNDIVTEDPQVDAPPEGDFATDAEALDEVPWYGVLVVEGEKTGDRRKFANGSLRWRDLPLPLAWQRETQDGHDGSVTVGRIDTIERVDNEMRGTGVLFTSVPETDEVIGLMANGGLRGVSIDADDATMTVETKDGENLETLMEELTPGDEDSFVEIDPNELVSVFTDARICGATLCSIPAFAQAFVALGTWPNEDEANLAAACFSEQEFAISEKPWDGSASRFSDEEWQRSCILDRGSSFSTPKERYALPIKEPNGDLSRAAVHAAAGRVDQVNASDSAKSSARSALRSAYGTLGEDVPDSLAASGAIDIIAAELMTIFDIDEATAMATAERFVKTEDGPGWLTHPVDTERLRRYWVRGEGAAKIKWGIPGDFNRCRRHLAKYIKPMYLSGYCANRHYDALGFWPGRPVSGDTETFEGESVHLVASGSVERPPAEWFSDPGLVGPTPLTVTEDGHVFGHLATWGVCHIGIPGTCTTAPPSPSDYAYFKTGAVVAEDGEEIAVGQITMGTGHANLQAGARAAAAHYDNTGLAVADVAAGDDEYGIWVSGAIRPTATPEQIASLRGAALSGDWRRIGGNLEMVGALAVNVPGFPIPRTSLAASAGEQTTLVAAGVVDHIPMKIGKIDIGSAVEEYLTKREARGKMLDIQARVSRERMATLAATRERI